MFHLTRDNKSIWLLSTLVLFSSLTLISQNTYAASFDDILNYLKNFMNDGSSATTSLITIFGNLDGTFRVGIAITVMVARIMAIYLAWSAILKLIRVSDNRETLGGVFFTFAASGLLFSVVSMLDLLSNTLGLGSANKAIIEGTSMTKACAGIIGASCSSGSDSIWQNTSSALISIISLFRLAGTLAVVKGILALHELGHGKGQATYGKVFVSMIAGAVLYNVVPFAVMVTRQFAPGAESFFLDGSGKVFIP